MSPLPSKQLGHGGPTVPAMGLGLMGMSAYYVDTENTSDEARFEVLDAAYKAGLTLWDSADVYGDSEDLVGKWFARTGKRSEITLMSKFGCIDINNDRKFDSSPEYVHSACQKSLERLGVESIDVYFCQRPDGKTPIEKTVKAMIELKESGKIQHLGMSQCSADTLRRAHTVHPIAAVQIEYNPFFLDSESNGLISAAQELGIAVIPYAPLGRGFGTGAFQSPTDINSNDVRTVSPRFAAKNWPQNVKLVHDLAAYAEKKNVSLPQLILAWEMAQPGTVIPIPGATSTAQLYDDLGALRIEISAEDDAAVRSLISQAPQVGGIYPNIDSKALFQDTPPTVNLGKIEDPEDLWLTCT